VNEERADRTVNHQAIPFHPVLFAVAPILFVYAYNGTKIPIDPGELLLPIALSLAMTAVLWTILGFAFHSLTRAAQFVSLFLMLFFSYGHVAEAFGPREQVWIDLLVFWAQMMAAGTWLAVRRSRRAVRGSQSVVTVLLNCVSAATLLLNLPAVVRAYAHRPPRVARASAQVATATGRDYPDIYYIITDSYVRSDALKSHYHTDNTGFLNDLSRMGFFVADLARSNYVQTYLSLASSLNFTYLDSLAETFGPESDNRGPLIEMIQDSRLVDFLRRRGYSIVSFASGSTGTDLAGADVHFAPRWSLSEFQTILENTTLLRDVSYLLGVSPADLHRNRVLYTLRELPSAGMSRHPVFVWAHILCPHAPFVFDARGERPGRYTFHGDDYGSQVIFLDSLIKVAIQRILAESPRPPIIVIQGDHGPGAVVDWHHLPRDQMLDQVAIFYAVYLPSSAKFLQASAGLYDSITPVNTFRVVLNRFFDTTMTLLPDRSYFSVSGSPYRFYDAGRPESYPLRNGPTGGR
jgi:hypothetical protein